MAHAAQVHGGPAATDGGHSQCTGTLGCKSTLHDWIRPSCPTAEAFTMQCSPRNETRRESPHRADSRASWTATSFLDPFGVKVLFLVSVLGLRAVIRGRNLRGSLSSTHLYLPAGVSFQNSEKLNHCGRRARETSLRSC